MGPLGLGVNSTSAGSPLLVSIHGCFCSQSLPRALRSGLGVSTVLLGCYGCDFIYEISPFCLIPELCQLNFHYIPLSYFFCKPRYPFFELLCQEVISILFLDFLGLC